MEHTRNIPCVRWLLFAALIFWAVAPSSAMQKETYVFAVIPSSPPVTMHTLWAPFIERLSRDTGMHFRLQVYEKMSDFERDITNGTPDFIFASPLQAVVAHESQGYVPLVRGSRLVTAEVFVRKDSPISAIDELSGKKIAFVGNKSL